MNGFFWFLKYILLGPALRALYRPWITGMENVPKEGAAILAGNHVSFFDSIFLPLMLDRHVTFLAKSEYFTAKGLRGWAMRLFFAGTGQLPIDRSGGKASEDSLNTGLRVLASGELLGIYPEGTRSPDHKLYRGRTGIARMLLEARVPVIPVAMVGTQELMPAGAKLPRIRRIGVVIGEPLDFSRFAGLEGDRYILRAVTDAIQYTLWELSGQQYADVYASSIKATTPSLNR